MPRRFLTPALACWLVGVFSLGTAMAQSKVEKLPFGRTKDGTPVDLYVLKNPSGFTVKIMTYGGIVTEILAPDRAGKFDDVVLGFDALEGYLGTHPYFGAITGRYANRIARGKFTLDGKQYELATNNGPNHLHGGKVGFDKRVWTATPVDTPEGACVRFSYVSPDGEEGYPGTLTTTVTYLVTPKNELKIHYLATTDKPTVLNLTNHSYFNLGGRKADNVLDHEVTLMADAYLPTDDGLIPTGEIAPVAGTPFDFTKPTAIGANIAKVKGDPGGYDLNYVLRGGGKGLALAARVNDPKTGRVLEAYTDEPGMQFYTGNFLDGSNRGKDGVAYKKHHGFCLEAQHFPDSPNQPKFPSVVLRPGEKYEQTTVYAFSAQK